MRMPRLGLALSGGGVRASVFHLGVLGRLAEMGALEQVGYIFLQHVTAFNEVQRRGREAADVLVAIAVSLLD